LASRAPFLYFPPKTPHHPGPLLPSPPTLPHREKREKNNHSNLESLCFFSPLPVREGGMGRERGRGEGLRRLLENLFQEPSRRGTELVRPLVPALEHEGPDVHPLTAQQIHIVLHLNGVVVLLAGAPAQEDGREAVEPAVRQLGRDVAAEHDYPL